MASDCASAEGSGPPLQTGACAIWKLTSIRSLRSSSTKSTLPVADRACAEALAASVKSAGVLMLTVGASLLPVTVMMTARSAWPALLSLARTVYVSVSCSPSARWLKCSLPELKLQFRVPLVLELPTMVPLFTLSIASKAALLDCRPVVVPVATTCTTDGLTVLARSTSLTLNVPSAVSAALVSVSAAVSASWLSRLITGASLLPVIVRVTVSLSLRAVPLSSVAVTV